MGSKSCKYCNADIPSGASSCPQCGATRGSSSATKIFVASGVIFTFLALWTGSDVIEVDGDTIVELVHTEEGLTNPELVILDKMDRSLPDYTRVNYKLLWTDNEASQEVLRAHVEDLWAQESHNWDEGLITVYLSDQENPNQPHVVARFEDENLITWTSGGQTVSSPVPVASVMKEATQAVEEQEINFSTEPHEFLALVEVEEVNAGQLRIDVKTDFPDGTQLYLYVRRPFWQKGHVEESWGTLYSGDVTVSNGYVSALVDVDDSNWVNEHEVNRETFGNPEIFGEIADISREVRVGLFVSPLRNQSAEVREVLGQRGERISGPGAVKSGDLTTYRVDTSIEMPVSKFI